MTASVTIDNLLALRDQGMSNTQIARHLGVGRSRISQVFTRAGHPARVRAELPPADELVHLLGALTTTELAGVLGCNPDSITKKIRQARERGELPDPPPPPPAPPPAIDDDAWANVPCKQEDPDLFFLTSNPKTNATRRDAREIAARTCKRCHMLDACYQGALARREPWGVWGGVLFHDGAPVGDGQRGAA